MPACREQGRGQLDGRRSASGVAYPPGGSSSAPPVALRSACVVLFIQAIVLGLLQGLTEFLPVSSSGHLQAVPYLVGWESGGSVAFDVLVHTGTLLAVLWYFRADLLELASNAVRPRQSAAVRRRAWTLIGLLALGTVPAAAAGMLLADVFEAAFASPRAIAGFLYLTGALLYTAERLRARRARPSDPTEKGMDQRRSLPTSEARGLSTSAPARAQADTRLRDDPGRDVTSLRARDAATIGAAQALALFPGISRAGATIATGMALGMSRTAAARFSFLLSIPVILGATVMTIPEVSTPQPGTLPFGPAEMAAGTLAAAVSGYWAIRSLLSLVQRRSLNGFAVYVTLFATVLLIATFL